VYGLEALLPIECEIPSLKLAIELLPTTSTKEEHFCYLAHLDKTRNNAIMVNEAHKKCIEPHYEKNVNPHAFMKGDLVLL